MSEIHQYFILDHVSLNLGLSYLKGLYSYELFLDRVYVESIDRMIQGWILVSRVLTGDEIAKYHLMSEPID